MSKVISSNYRDVIHRDVFLLLVPLVTVQVVLSGEDMSEIGIHCVGKLFRRGVISGLATRHEHRAG